MLPDRLVNLSPARSAVGGPSARYLTEPKPSSAATAQRKSIASADAHYLFLWNTADKLPVLNILPPFLIPVKSFWKLSDCNSMIVGTFFQVSKLLNR